MAFPVGALINGDGGVQVTVADKSFISKLFNFFFAILVEYSMDVHERSRQYCVEF